MTLTADRVRAHSATAVIRRIDDSTTAALARMADASAEEVASRLRELDAEWDTDRTLEAEAAAMGLTGLALGTLVRPQLLALPAFVAAAVLLHAKTGHYPLMPLFRRWGVRTAREIARERHALKALRGDFAGLDAAPAAARPEPAHGGPAATAPDLEKASARTAARLPPTTLRVERQTAPELNAAIAERTAAEIIRLEGAPPAEIAARLRELDREWDIERVLQANASTLVLVGVALGARVDRRFLLLSAAVFSFLAQHALQGWCPPLPVLRRLGVRTAREIERERYTLKALRGDFAPVPAAHTAARNERVRAALTAVDA
jgi:hypothetical protein